MTILVIFYVWVKNLLIIFMKFNKNNRMLKNTLNDKVLEKIIKNMFLQWPYFLFRCVVVGTLAELND